MEQIELHCRMIDADLSKYGVQIGEMLYPDIVSENYDRACSDMISMQMVSVLGDISCVCNHSYSEIISSFQLMTRWINYKKIAFCMKIALEKWLKPQAEIIFDESFLSAGIEDYPRRIQEDICVFCGWAIYRGADGASIRKGIPSQTQKHIRNIIKCRGDNGIINRLWRALAAFIPFSEKAIEPEYAKMLKSMRHGIKQDASFNTKQSAFQKIKK